MLKYITAFTVVHLFFISFFGTMRQATLSHTKRDGLGRLFLINDLMYAAYGQLGKSVKKMIPTAVAISGVTTVIQKMGM